MGYLSSAGTGKKGLVALAVIKFEHCFSCPDINNNNTNNSSGGYLPGVDSGILSMGIYLKAFSLILMF